MFVDPPSARSTIIAFSNASCVRISDGLISFSMSVNIFLADVCTYIYDVPHIVIKLKDSRKRVLVDDRVKCICLFDLFLDNYEKASEGEVGR